MPESKGRAKPTHTPPPHKPSKKTMANPPWFVPVMLGLMLVGLHHGGEVPDSERQLLEPDHRLRTDDQRLHDDHALALNSRSQPAGQDLSTGVVPSWGQMTLV